MTLDSGLSPLPISTFNIPPLQVFTWKSVLAPCSLAGLRGANGLRVLQKWMLESKGLGVSRMGVCNTQEDRSWTCQDRAPSFHRYKQTHTLSPPPQMSLRLKFYHKEKLRNYFII